MLCICFLVVANVVLSFSHLRFVEQLCCSYYYCCWCCYCFTFFSYISNFFSSLQLLLVASGLNCSFTSRLLERVITVVLLCQRCASFYSITFDLVTMPGTTTDRKSEKDYVVCMLLLLLFLLDLQQTRLITMEIFQTCFIVIIQLICSLRTLFAPLFSFHVLSLFFRTV